MADDRARIGYPDRDHAALGGIYGPGRNGRSSSWKRGTAKRIVKPGQVFSRIHVDRTLPVRRLSSRDKRIGGVFNIADDEPGPPQDVIAYAAEVMGP